MINDLLKTILRLKNMEKIIITADLIKKIVPGAAGNVRANRNFSGMTLEGIVEMMNKFAAEGDVDTPMRWAHGLAQVMHESGGLRYSEELASGKAYEGRKDLGNTRRGDGIRYKGRGLIQVTGRSNYTKYKAYCGYDVVEQPELLSRPVGAVRSAMWYWKTNALNYYADRDDVRSVTRRINGGENGLANRQRLLERAKRALGIV